MTETKVTIDDAVKHIATTLSQHADTIRCLQDTITSLQPQLDTLRSTNQQEMRSLETNLTNLFTSKDAMWTQVSGDLHDLNLGLVGVKNLFTSHRSTASPLTEAILTPRSSHPHDSPNNQPSPPALNFT